MRWEVLKKFKIFYQIKSLEKILFKKITNIDEIKEKNMELKITPLGTQMEILAYLFEHADEKICQKDLEEILDLKRATISGVLQTMEKNKIIERAIDDEDTRTKKIILNKDAKETYLKNYKMIEEMEEKVIKDISQEELETFLDVIEKMKKNILE